MRTQLNGHFLLGDRTPYDNKHLHGWRGTEHLGKDGYPTVNIGV